MTRKDFQLIADVVNALGERLPRALMAPAFADALATTNPNFDRARFLKACGVNGESR